MGRLKDTTMGKLFVVSLVIQEGNETTLLTFNIKANNQYEAFGKAQEHAKSKRPNMVLLLHVESLITQELIHWAQTEDTN
jgi:hypothetical protein